MNPLNFAQMFAQFRQNPMSMLSRRFNLPAGMNDPQAIVQHLLNSGQVSQAQVNSAMQMRNSPMIQNYFR